MRHVLLLALGILEVVLALTLSWIGWLLPARDQVEQTFRHAEGVSCKVENQLDRLRQRIKDLRRPELQQLADRLKGQLHMLTTVLRDQQVDFATVARLRDGLGQVVVGLTQVSDTLDPAPLNKLGDGLATAADFLDQKLAPAAGAAAQHLEQATQLLREDARRLADFVRDHPADLKGVRQVHESLGQFSRGLTKLSLMLQFQRVATMREGFQGMNEALTTAADNVERLASYTYPVLTFDGLRPEIDQRPFWPAGEKIAAGLRKASKGVEAADRELQVLNKNLPELKSALEASQKILETTREALGSALQHQDQVENTLKQLPEQAAKLVEHLPKISQELARMLRDSKRFEQVAEALRKARQHLDATVQRWPAVRQAITGTATLLDTARQQLDRALESKQEYEKAQRQTAALVEAFSTVLPELSDQMTGHLREEERSLEELGKSVHALGRTLPGYGTAVGQMVQLGAALLWLVAALLGMHGLYLVCTRKGFSHGREDYDRGGPGN